MKFFKARGKGLHLGLLTFVVLSSLLIIKVSLTEVESKNNEQANYGNTNNVDSSDPARPTIKTVDQLRSLIYEVARENMKSTNMSMKAKAFGILPSNMPSQMKERAMHSRKDNKIFGKIMSIPIEVYRTCVYPVAKINYVKWCSNVNFGNNDKTLSCQLSFCNICCDNLSYELTQMATESRFATNLGLTATDMGTQMKDFIVKGDKITECRNRCMKIYPASLPSPVTTPKRDPTLGNRENPARDCMDIKTWGNKDSRSGKYWAKFGFQGAVEMYCDMETDGGGWTLFFNYKHSIGQELSLNQSILPNDPQITNSHLLLKELGVKREQVTALRFQCMETFISDRNYMHFKVTNNDIIETAFTGDQSALTPNSWKAGFTPLERPGGWDNFRDKLGRVQISTLDYANKSNNGGFSVTPFGSKKFDSFWTVVGDDPRNAIFECGSYHRNILDSLGPKNPSMARTHHSIYFKGQPPSVEDVRQRMMYTINKRARSG